MPLLLSAIAKSTASSDINLVIGTPINQRDTKEEFINKLKDKTFVFEYTNEKGKVQTTLINIHKVEVILEGLGSVKYLPAAAGKRSILIDIGGWTTNVIYISGGKIIDAFTIDKGILSFYKLIKDREEGTGELYSLEEIEDAIKQGYINNYSLEKITIFNTIVKEIQNRRNTKLVDIYFTGGGSTDFQEYIHQIGGTILQDNVFTNVKGNLKIAEEIWNG